MSRNAVLLRVLFLYLFLVLIVLTPSAEEPRNLVLDGGFEEVREVVISSSQYFIRALEGGAELTREGPIVIIPSNFFQFLRLDNLKLKVIEGEQGKEVHTGRRAILLSGTFYLRVTDRSAETGDVFTARYYARGNGSVRVILGLFNKDGKYFSQVVPRPVTVNSDEWMLIEHRLDTSDKIVHQKGEAQLDLARMQPRLEVLGEVYIDDLEIVKEEKQQF